MKKTPKEYFTRFIEIMIAIIIALVVLAIAPHRAHAATWNVELHAIHTGEVFDLKGKLTTPGSDLTRGQPITGFAGSFSDGIGSTTALMYMVPMSQWNAFGVKAGNFGSYDNMLYSTYLPDAVNNGGFLLSTRTGFVQVMSILTPIGYHYVSKGQTNMVFVDGSITLDKP